MGAGISTKQRSGYIYRRLQKIKRQLRDAGVPSEYHNYQLCRYEPVGTQSVGGWNISFRTIHASNGESASWPVISIVDSLEGDLRFGGPGVSYTYREAPITKGSFEDGLKKLVELFREFEHVRLALEETRQGAGSVVAIENRRNAI
jgi:hypothetical protein